MACRRESDFTRYVTYRRRSGAGLGCCLDITKLFVEAPTPIPFNEIESVAFAIDLGRRYGDEPRWRVRPKTTCAAQRPEVQRGPRCDIFFQAIQSLLIACTECYT